MRGPSSGSDRWTEIRWKLLVSLVAAALFGMGAYFHRSLSTRGYASFRPDHNLGEALFSASFGFILVSLMLFFGTKRTDSSKRKALEAAFYGIAGRLNGKVIPASWPQPPRIHFPAQGRSATLEFSPDDSYEGMTRVTVDFKACSPGTLLIFHDGIKSVIPRLFGAQDISVGDPQFDHSHVIQASEESIAQRIFRADRRAQVIESIMRIDALPHATIHLTRECLTVRARGYLHRETELWAMARTAMDFTRFILELDPLQGVTWGEVSGQEGDCPICGNPLENRTVQCTRCRTPHHLDCWKYNGRCSIFACGETHFRIQDHH
jgi:hypothetical protein